MESLTVCESWLGGFDFSFLGVDGRTGVLRGGSVGW